MLSPETLAVMKPSVAAASAMVDMWPMEITEDMNILCSNASALATLASVKMYAGKQEDRLRTQTRGEHTW